MSVMKTQAVKAFLSANAPADLADLYTPNMEVQVTVAKDSGERMEGDFKGKVWHGYTDGIQVWKPIRIPRNANTIPEYEDSPMTYDLQAHAEGIGMTGWDWHDRLSRWVAFDFDAIVGHSEKHSKKLSEDELIAIRTALANVPTVTIRKSTGGKGLHIYVFLQPLHTANHNEHAAVARAILSQLSGIAGFDFSSKVDICGGNMWVWHRKLKGSDGLQIIKQGTALADVPANWRDYTKVVSGRRQKNLPKFIETQTTSHQDIESVFEELTGQRLRTQPDAEHKRLMDWLTTNYGSCTWWDAEHHMLVTHTVALKEAHTELNLRGKFETTAVGSEKGYDHNCFAFPITKGSWAVRRYTLGVAEHAFWEQDGAGWTRCFYNREPDLGGASRIYEGVERPEGGYHFSTAEAAQNAAYLLGADLKLPNWILGKPATLKIHKTGRLVAEVDKDANTPEMAGWIVKGKKAAKIFNIKSPGPNESDTFKIDERLRHLVGEDCMDAGWVIRTSDGDWHGEPFQNVKVYLQGLGYQPKDVAAIMGSNIEQCWKLVNRPFKDEYPKDREWNRKAAQLRFKPSLNRDQLNYSNWMKILHHCGKGLDDAVRQHPWCKSNGVLTGADWLKCWIASLFQEPNEPLPYIFFYGPQDSGKSIFHEALSLLMTCGVVRADTALTSQSGFNGELESAVLCVVEETNLQKNQVAYNRIKDWVTSRQLPVHRKQRQPYSVQNTTHWVQCLPATEWIMTAEGHRQIRYLIGVQTDVIVDGLKYRTTGFFRSGTKEVFELRTKQGHKLHATSEHPVLVDYDGYRMWRKIGELSPGDVVCFNKHANVEWLGNGNFSQGYLLGYLFADGTLTNCHIEVEEPDRPLLPFILSCLDGEYTLNALKTRWEIHGPAIRDICEAFGVTDQKVINVHIEEASSDFLSGFLSGLFDGDGCVNVTEANYLRVCFQQTDPAIREAVQRILLCFGIYSKNTGEQLRVCNESIKTFQDRIGFQHPVKKAKLAELLKGKKFRANNDFTDTVASVTPYSTEEVYDVTVPGAECFSANGFKVHNCANSHLACPVFPGDTRITMILVDSIDPAQMIPKKQFLPMLEAEAGDFIAELLGLELPSSNDRLNVPCIATEDKTLAEYANKTFLEIFIEEKCFWAPGHRVKFGELYNRFQEWLDPQHAHLWSSIRVGRELPPKFPKARMANNEMWIGNISFEHVPPEKFGLKHIVRDGKLVHDEVRA